MTVSPTQLVPHLNMPNIALSDYPNHAIRDALIEQARHRLNSDARTTRPLTVAEIRQAINGMASNSTIYTIDTQEGHLLGLLEHRAERHIIQEISLPTEWP